MKRSPLSLESISYLVFLGLLLAAPVAVEWLQVGGGTSPAFDWADVLIAWRRILPYVLVFLLHNYVLAAWLMRRDRRRYYWLSVILVVALFFLFQCRQGPPHDLPPLSDSRAVEAPPIPHHPRRPHHPSAPRHRPMQGDRELWDTLLLVLMLGMNIGVKLYFRQREDARRLSELERSNLEQQLAQLRYQLNPHFLMNTLNNIHALVEIDPLEAQQSIIELSRLLRYVLYDADRAHVHLRSELEFMQHYVALMRVRYADSVSLQVEVQPHLPEAEVPPLLFITFVENAFKHGVSYAQPSYIHISVDTAQGDTALTFTCTNSKHPATAAAEAGGVGLRNVRRRLDLLYADSYTLDIRDADDTYTVSLTIPLRSS